MRAFCPSHQAAQFRGGVIATTYRDQCASCRKDQDDLRTAEVQASADKLAQDRREATARIPALIRELQDAGMPGIKERFSYASKKIRFSSATKTVAIPQEPAVPLGKLYWKFRYIAMYSDQDGVTQHFSAVETAITRSGEIVLMEPSSYKLMKDLEFVGYETDLAKALEACLQGHSDIK